MMYVPVLLSVCSRLTDYLEFWVGIEHDVLNGALDVLSPAGQPCHSVVMSDLLPVVTNRRHRDTAFSVNERETARNNVCMCTHSQHWSTSYNILQGLKPSKHKCMTPLPEKNTTVVISIYVRWIVELVQMGVNKWCVTIILEWCTALT